jgi:hypothetical protein
MLTFLGVVLAFVVFRAESWGSAITVIEAMLPTGQWLPGERYLSQILENVAYDPLEGLFEMVAGDVVILMILVVSFLIAVVPPSAVDMVNGPDIGFTMSRSPEALRATSFRVRSSLSWTVLLAVLGWLCLNSITRLSPFLYFQF